MEIKDKTGCAGSLGRAWPTLHQRLINLRGLTKAVSSLGIRNSSLSPQHPSLEPWQRILEGDPHF